MISANDVDVFVYLAEINTAVPDWVVGEELFSRSGLFVIAAAVVLFVCLGHFQTYPTIAKFTDIFCRLGILLDGHCHFYK